MKKSIYAVILAIVTMFGTVGFAQDNLSVFEHYTNVLKEEGKTPGEKYITRSEFIAVLMKQLNYTRDVYICSFDDVSDSDWEYVYIANAEHKKIAMGTDNAKFSPHALLSVQEAITFVSRAYTINPYFGENEKSTLINFGGNSYSENYIKYALVEGLYPKKNNIPVEATGYITAEQALMLICDYAEKDGFSNDYIKFLSGYPKITKTGNSSSIGILIKTNKPCKIYSKVVLSDKVSGAYSPERAEVDDFLTAVSLPNKEIRVTIPAKQLESYNIFLTAVDENGAMSSVYSFKNISPLPFTIGDGSKANPYRIYTKYQLNHIRNYPDKSFLLCTDIEYNDMWEPIGISMEQNEMFTGIFDGGGHSITGLRIDNDNYAGMFAVLYGGTIRNVNISADVRGKSYVGVIAGLSQGGIIEACHVSGFCDAEENLAGGIVGKNNGSIKNCVSALYTITSTAYSGGIVGSNVGTISDCISAVTSIYADMYSSSIAGINTNGIISNCVAASVEVRDSLTENSGRISTNREKGRCKNNYVYEGMISGENIYVDKDGQDGKEVSWEEITSRGFYEDVLGWSFAGRWAFKGNFLLPCLKYVKEPVLQPGITMYAPLGISNEKELISIKNNLNGHYYLKNNITLTKGKSWTPIGLAKDNDDYEKGFRGTLDGRGYQIVNLQMKYDEGIMQYGLFGVLYGGTVRNLTLSNINIEGHSYVGAICGVNYGTISACNTSGQIKAVRYDRETLAGGICAINYTNIYSAKSNVDIVIDAASATGGGIAAQNEGFIHGCSYNANMSAISRGKSDNAILGGICGINYSGMIYNCSAGKNIMSKTHTTYCGGIVGVLNGGEIYKCSSYGNISASLMGVLPSYAYTGGICGMISGGIVMNSFSQCNQMVSADKIYSGGIAGYSENSSIQNVYSINKINQKGKEKNSQIFAGGISAYNKDGNISGAVAINPYIITNGIVGKICAFTSGGYIDNNYYSDSIYTNGKDENETEFGTLVPLKTIARKEFFTTPVENGGLLGWMGNDKIESVWVNSQRISYPFPVLFGVENQSMFVLPDELKRYK